MMTEPIDTVETKEGTIYLFENPRGYRWVLQQGNAYVAKGTVHREIPIEDYKRQLLDVFGKPSPLWNK